MWLLLYNDVVIV